MGTCVCGVGSFYEQWTWVDMGWAVSKRSGHGRVWSKQSVSAVGMGVHGVGSLYEQSAQMYMEWAVSMSSAHVWI